MVIVMDMHSGKVVRAPAAYDEEVMNAGWLPPTAQSAGDPEPATGLQTMDRAAREAMPPPEDIDAFLRAIYRNQE